MARTLKKFVQDHDDRDALRNRIIDEMLRNGPGCSLNHLDVSHITNMEGLFQRLNFTGDISKWDVSNVLTMENMFEGCPFNGDLSKWDVSAVRVMRGMFEGSSFNGDISQWDVSNVTTMERMFKTSFFNGDISVWNTGRVTNMGHMFMMSVFTGDLSKWNVSSVRDMCNMFEGAAFNGDLSHWDVRQADDMQQMFQYSHFNGDVSGWKLNPKALLGWLFKNCPFQGDFPHLDISSYSGPSLVDPSYRGRFKNRYHLYNAERIFGDAKALNSYIRDTADVQLDRLHFEKLLELKSKPKWIATDIYQWVKKQQPLLEGLGMKESEKGLWLQENFAMRKNEEPSYPLDVLQLEASGP